MARDTGDAEGWMALPQMAAQKPGRPEADCAGRTEHRAGRRLGGGKNAVKTDDVQRVYDPDWHRTDRMYVPTTIRAEEMTLRQLLPGLCHMADTRGDKCRSCGGCGFGRRLVRLADAARTAPGRQTDEKAPTEIPAGAKLARGMTTAQMARVERMKQERRARVAKAQELIRTGMRVPQAVVMAGYNNADAYIKALKKCEKEQEEKGHV